MKENGEETQESDKAGSKNSNTKKYRKLYKILSNGRSAKGALNLETLDV